MNAQQSDRTTPLGRTQEHSAFKLNGFFVLFISLGLASVGGWLEKDAYTLVATSHFPGLFSPEVLGALLAALALLSLPGFLALQPNQACVLTFLGNYVGSLRTPGFWWVNPLTSKRRVSLRVRNFNSDRLKVNDARGNPIEIGAVVAWRVVDSARATFDVDRYVEFVAIQSETAIRALAIRYPYDTGEENEASLRGNPDEISAALKREVELRLEVAGVEVVESRLSHLAYAPEIAQVMLRRQQAQAIIAARQQIIEGALSMVEMALKRLSDRGLLDLNETTKAAMVNNLLVVLTAEQNIQPVLNTGNRE